MKRIVGKRIVAMLACALIGAAGLAQRDLPVAPKPATPAASEARTPVSAPAAPALTASDLSAWFDGYFPGALEAGKIAGAQVVVVKDGQVLVKKGYGYADVAAKKPMDVDRTLMRIGSTSKLFTWTAVMQQVQAGRIDLNADINRYLDFHITPRAGRTITMNDLMRHRGGFEEGLKDLLTDDPARLKTTERYLKENLRPQLFPAGEAPAYSNYGTALAGYIVQRVSGEPFDSYIERHILSPLRMTHTTFRQPLPPAFAPFMSKGYRQSDQPPAAFELVGTAPAGAVSTTGADMANFMIAHLQDGQFDGAQILRPDIARLMHTPAVMPQPGFDTLAHGFFWSHRNNRLVIGHGGDTLVFHTDLNLLPDEHVGIYVTFNSRGENDAVYGVRERLFDLFMDRYFPAPKPVTPPAIASAAADASAIAGRYEGSRRVESGFIGVFYLLQQDQVTANPDGTISVSSIEGKQFREVARGLWREVGGDRQLQVTEVAGRRAMLDSGNPVEIRQATSLARNARLNTWIAGLSVLVLLLTAIGWPAAWWLRRRYGAPVTLSGRPALARRLTRAAAIADLVYIAGWYAILAPILKTEVQVYNNSLDAPIRALQIAAIVPIVGAAVGLWNAWLTWQPGRDWGARLRAVIVAAALLGIVWVAWAGKLMSFNLNY
ncbi:CubicO group peptidase, beta-lactamase class C family [Sphingomonas gellani]|uniref:CubicO group peptidase, beta-lactamase class C family n=1 Tax=Sphingomonas gellani TaxID=1166340 RepID=A0A1H8ALU8_9SPHN|nr:serine hydrolase domain-containing protein [Sphingomonas gellani]SEM71486.1 CubicO group peptidase, beta-lactamase class C family [Sphingomonas gellani]